MLVGKSFYHKLSVMRCVTIVKKILFEKEKDNNELDCHVAHDVPHNDSDK